MIAESVVTDLSHIFTQIRQQTRQLAETCSAEDLTPQSMPDASPGKWHLAHTTWFFETFILQNFENKFRWHDEQYCYLFNSYYDSVGSRHARPQRGLLTRPSLEEVMEYRANVDARLLAVLDSDTSHSIASDTGAEFGIDQLLTIGLHHEMQHQELFLTDMLHLLSHNPLAPSITAPNESSAIVAPCEGKMMRFDGGLVDVGLDAASGEPWPSFSYDCEQPRHQVFLQPFALGSDLVSNSSWLEFIDDGGYQNPLLWLSDGWARCQQEKWTAPLYWQETDGQWQHYGLDGLQPLDLAAPVSHVSFYEADAFARWAGKRLPREHEWELAASKQSISGNFLESRHWRAKALPRSAAKLNDAYGNVWEWTQSPFQAYPGFKAKQGALGEYNGKFMANQMVLKGGSCATPVLQIRPSYRNFFYPHQRWQFTGLRLAEDC